jgi:hypothetical protein
VSDEALVGSGSELYPSAENSSMLSPGRIEGVPVSERDWWRHEAALLSSLFEA